MELFNIINKICGFLPDHHQIDLCMENGSAWIELHCRGLEIKLPDSSGKTIVEQLNDALCVANGFDKE